jgi:predicted PurR-regulated permease PerM
MARIPTEAPPASPPRVSDPPVATVTRLRGDDAVPRGLAVASAIIIRLVIVLGGMWLLGLVVTKMLVVVLPLVVALLLATLLAPPTRALERRGWHSGLAALATVGSGLIIVIATLSLIIPVFIAELGSLGSTVEQGIRQLGATLARSPLGLTPVQIDRSIDRAVSGIGGSGGQVAQGVISGALLATQWATSALLAIFLTFFFVKDGPAMWAWTTSLVGSRRRPVFHDLGVRAWTVLTAYVHGVALVATVDAVLIGIVLFLLGIPLALPLIVLTFIAAFFPIIGALVAGAAAVLVALVTNGVAAAVIMLAAIIFIQQLEGNVLYPVVVGRQLNLHPVAMLLALAIGAVVAGVAGAFLAVPVAAVIGASLNYARSAERIAPSGPLSTSDLVVRPGG